MPKTTKYPYSIRNLKTLNTHDGQALTGTLYRGPVKVGTVEDTGTGGGTWPSFIDRAEREAFADWVGRLGNVTYPACSEMDAITFPHNTESALDLLLTEVEEAKEAAKFDKASKTKLLYRKAADSLEVYREAKIPAQAVALPQPALIEMYRQKAPWFAEVAAVWIIGQGWTTIQAK